MAIGTSGLRDPLRDVQQDSPAFVCELCKGDVYSGAPLFHRHGRRICVECFTDWVNARLQLEPEEVAAALGVEVESA